jgi:hypothetical protein
MYIAVHLASNAFSDDEISDGSEDDDTSVMKKNSFSFRTSITDSNLIPPPGNLLPASLPVRVNQSTNSTLLVEANAAEQARKVKLVGRRRLCKLADTAKTNPTARQLAPLSCTITADPDAEDGASSPLHVSSSDDEATAITRRPQPTSVASAFTDYACAKGTKDAGRINRVSKASSFADSDYHDGDEGEGTVAAYAAKDVTRKRRPPKASTFRNNDDTCDDGLGQEKENRGVVDNDAEDVGWEKTEDFKMEPTGTAATSKPYKLPGRILRCFTLISVRASGGSGFCIAGEPGGS